MKIKLIGGAMHGKTIDIIGGDFVSIPVYPNSRTPKQQLGRWGALVYKKIKDGIYKLVSGYYEQQEKL